MKSLARADARSDTHAVTIVDANHAAPTDDPWPRVKMFAVRLAAIFALLNVPFLVWLLPYGDRVGGWIVPRLDRPIIWFGESVLGFAQVVRRETGSGDTAYNWSLTALFLVIATVGALVWTTVSKRREHDRLLAGLYIVLRYGLALAMLQYGLVKVLPSQFPAPQGDLLLMPLGDATPMGLLWRYMGFSHAFNLLTGGVEIVGGLLLLFRRTWLAGALVSAAAMAQVVAINFIFDVPVKIFSSELLVAAIVLTLPFARRVLLAIFTDRALPRRAPAPLVLPANAVRFKTPLKSIVVVACLGFMMNGAWQVYNEWGQGVSFELAGVYNVAATDAEDVVATTTVVSIDHFKQMSLWGQVGDPTTQRRYFVELADGVLTMTGFAGPSGTFEVTRDGPDTVVLSGRLGSKDVNFSLVERPTPLLDGGFHWVSEFPNNQ